MMKMVMQDAEIELVSLIHSINKAAESWDGWMCLHIALPQLSSYSDNAQAMDCIRPLLDSCLKDIEGNSFFCEEDVFVICKNTSDSVLQEIGCHACDLVLEESVPRSGFKIFDLSHDGQSFVDYYCQQGEPFTIFSLPRDVSNLKYANTKNAFSPQEEKILKNPERSEFLKVLLVEDDPVTRWMVRNALRTECQFATAQDGNKALSLYKSYKPDIVFLDINLPGRDGISVLNWIMQHDPGAYIVMFSSESHLDTMVNTLEDGAKGFIAKPFRKDQLIHYLESCPTAH